MRKSYKNIVVAILGMFLVSGCGESVKKTDTNKPTKNEKGIFSEAILLPNSVYDKYNGFKVKNNVILSQMKTDDEIFNIPVDKDNNFYILDSLNREVRQFNVEGSLVRSIKLNMPNPSAIQYRDNNFYVLDKKEQIIYKTDDDFNVTGRILEGKPVQNRIGNYKAFIDSKGLFYLLNYDDGILEVFNASFKKMREIKTSINGDIKFAIDHEKMRLFIGDLQKRKIHCYDLRKGNEIYSIGDKGKYIELGSYFDISLIDNRLFVVDRDNNRFQIYDNENGEFIKNIGTQGAGEGQFVRPLDIYSDQGMVFILENNGHRVQVFDKEGIFIRAISGYGNKDGYLNNPELIFGIPELGFIFVLDKSGKRVQCFDYNGNFIQKYSVLSGSFDSSFGVMADPQNNVFIVSPDGHRVINFSAESMISNVPQIAELASNITVNDKGSIIFINKNKFKIQVNEKDGRTLNLNYEISREKAENIDVTFDYFCIDSSKNIYVTDRYNHRIVKYDNNGKIVKSIGINLDSDKDYRLDSGYRRGEFKNPFFITNDFNDNLYVADIGNYRIQKFNSNGDFITMFGKNGLGGGTFIGNFSFSINKDGIIAVSDYARSYIQLFDITGKYLSIFGRFGDGENQFINPLAIGFDNNGELLVLNSKSMEPFNRVDDLILKRLEIIDVFSEGLNLYSKGFFREALHYFKQISKYRKDEKTLFYGWYCSMKVNDLENKEYFGKLLRARNLSSELRDIVQKRGFDI